MGASEVADFRASSLGTLLEMVANGVGATLVPEMAARSLKRARRGLLLIPFSGQAPGRTIGLAFRPTTARRAEFEELGAVIAG